MWLFLIFVLIPIIEIGLFIEVGGYLGLWPTLAIVVLTAFIGTNLLRRQGLATLRRLQDNLSEGQNPVDPIAHAALILVSGILLVTPGFFTDGAGFALLVPLVRTALIKWGAARILRGNTVVFSNMSSSHHRDTSGPANSLDGEFTVLDEEEGTSGDSGWTNKP